MISMIRICEFLLNDVKYGRIINETVASMMQICRCQLPFKCANGVSARMSSVPVSGGALRWIADVLVRLSASVPMCWFANVRMCGCVGVRCAGA